MSVRVSGCFLSYRYSPDTALVPRGQISVLSGIIPQYPGAAAHELSRVAKSNIIIGLIFSPGYWLNILLVILSVSPDTGNTVRRYHYRQVEKIN